MFPHLTAVYSDMNRQTKSRLIFIILTFAITILVGQGTFQINGRVTDQETGDPLVGVNVLLKGTFIGAATNGNGEFIITNLNPKIYTLVFSMIGYTKMTFSISVDKNYPHLDIKLQQDVLSSPQVIVTASRKAQDIMESQLSVAVIGMRNIREKSAVSLAKVLPYEAGINTVKGQLNIRGASGYTMGAGERSLILLDGVPLLGSAAGNISWSVIPTSEIEQIEIIKSGGSALYGSSALGGVLNIITRNAPAKPETKIRIKTGKYSQPKYEQWQWRDKPGTYHTTEVTHAQPFGNHSGWLRLQRSKDGGATQLGWDESWNITGKWKWNYKSQYTASLYGNYYTDKSGLVNQWKSPADPFEAPVGDAKDYGVGSKLNINGFFNYIYSPNMVVKVKSALYDVHWKNHGRTNQNYSNEQKWFGETQINTNLFHSLNITAGSVLQHGSIDAEIFGNHTSLSAALYFLAQQRVLPQLTLSAGGRFESYHVDDDLLDQTFAPQVALNWRPQEWLAFRTSVSRGFRVPTIAEMFSKARMGIFEVDRNPDLEPEYSLSRELGVTVMIPGGKWISHIGIDGAIFHTDFENLIEPCANDTGAIQFQNVTNARIAGAEIGIKSGLLNNHLMVTSAYTWLDPVEVNEIGDVTDTLSYRFRHTWVNSATAYFFGFSAGLEYRYSSRIDNVELFEENPETGSDMRVPIHVWNAGFGYQRKGWELLFRVENILQYYYTELERNMGSERTFSVDFVKNF